MNTRLTLSELRARLTPDAQGSQWTFLSTTGRIWTWTKETKYWESKGMQSIAARDRYSPAGLMGEIGSFFYSTGKMDEDTFNNLLRKMLLDDKMVPIEPENEYGEVCP